MDSIEHDLIEALEEIDELCSGDEDSVLRDKISAVVAKALNKAEHHARLIALGAFNDE